MSGRLHLAHFTNSYHPVINGVVRSVSSFRQALTSLGHNVFVFAQYSDYEDSEPFIFRYPAIELPLANHFPLAIPISRFIDRVFPILKPGLIHSHHPFLLGQVAVNKAAELDLPFVFTFHTRYREYSHYVALSQKFVKEAIDRWLGDYMQHCQHIVVPSESIRRMLVTEYGVTERITVIPTGIDLVPYQQADGQPIRERRGWGQDKVLISVGRLAKEKNWSTLLEAFSWVAKRSDNVRLAILGAGDELAALEEYSRELGVDAQVEFVGAVPFDEIPNYLKAADLFCFASVTETQGLVTMEALAAGLPVVAVNATGTADVIDDGEQGLLTANDSQSLAEAIYEVLSDDNLRQRFQEAARHKAETFEFTRQAQKLLAVYQQAQIDKRAARFVHVDRHKPIFKFEWYELLGLERNPFT